MKALLLGVGLLLMGVAAASAHDYKLEEITIDHPWARASIGQAKAGAAYVTFVNEGDAADRLVAVKADVSELVELHTHTMEDGVMRMRAVPAIDLPAGATTELKPGGLHIMLLNLKAPLVEGQSFPATLVFENAGEIVVDVAIESMAEGMHDHSGHGSKEGDGHSHGHSHGSSSSE